MAPTSTPVGRYYQSEHDQVTLDQFSRATTEWDLLVFLAQHEGFDVWVAGNALYFQPGAAQLASRSLLPSDCIELRMERALTLAGDVEVVVKSWNSRQQSEVVQVASRPGSGSGAAGSSQRYVYVRPNLLPDQALQLAQRILADVSCHERVVRATMPGDVVLSPRSFVSLQGTGTDFDQVYQVAEVEREFSLARGFVQHLHVKTGSAAGNPVQGSISG